MNLTIFWLYPEYMSTYGDRGNIICLSNRCRWRGIKVKITGDLKNADLIFGGGAQDRQQSLIINDLLKQKKRLREMFTNKIPGLFVCGSPQLLGHYYETADGKKLPGLGLYKVHAVLGVFPGSVFCWVTRFTRIRANICFSYGFSTLFCLINLRYGNQGYQSDDRYHCPYYQ